MYDVIIAGGGAAGFYAAIQLATEHPGLSIGIFERGKTVLGKVKVSGGGRCNVTHAAFNPTDLVNHYPRGKKELLGPFHSHATGDVMEFFETRGVPLKIEEDGRIFPVSDNSQSIIDCFLEEAERLGVRILKNYAIKAINPLGNGKEGWRVTTKNKYYDCRYLVVATGSNPKIWEQLGGLGHHIVKPVPSLFTFNIADNRIKSIPGISTQAYVEVLPNNHLASNIVVALKSKPVKKEAILTAEGPVLVTHWGLSGPAILKLSAWGALPLHALNYTFKIRVNWVPEYTSASLFGLFLTVKDVEAKKTILKTKPVDLPRRLWTNLVKASGISTDLRWADASNQVLQGLVEQLTQCVFRVEGKSTFKEEFVTAGGVDLKEINFKTFESKVLANLYFAGEVINVDAITGGFNFQNAWTGAFLAAKAIVAKEESLKDIG